MAQWYAVSFYFLLKTIKKKFKWWRLRIGVGDCYDDFDGDWRMEEWVGGNPWDTSKTLFRLTLFF